jgi:hypothetical protein
MKHWILPVGDRGRPRELQKEGDGWAEIEVDNLCGGRKERWFSHRKQCDHGV